MGVEIRSVRLDREVWVAVAGEVDTRTSAQLRDVLLRALGEARLVVVDLGSVTAMDSAGVAVLTVVQRAASTGGNSLRLRGVPAELDRLVRITGLVDRLTVDITGDAITHPMGETSGAAAGRGGPGPLP
ncbi:MAG: STAS domain-containing protein [Mycobacteriales bacterium]